MDFCYFCDQPLSKKNSSEEHIIPNFLGGHLASHDLLCQEHNIKLGTEIDSVLANQIFLSYLIDFEIDRGKQKNKKIPVKIGKTDEGILINKKGQWSRIGSQIEYDEEGKFKSLKAPNLQEAKKILEKIKNRKEPSINIEDILANAEEREEFLNERIYFEDKSLGGVKFQRGICKIALNYYLYRFPDANNYKPLRDYVCGLGKAREFSTFYYTLFGNIYVPSEDEISHVVYLKGDKIKRLLYCYIELFNVHNFIVIIDNDYRGQSFELQYIYDLISGTEKRDHKVNLTLFANLLEKLKFPFYFEKHMRDMTELHNKKWDQLLPKLEKHMHRDIP